jgi:hypothetical protein
MNTLEDTIMDSLKDLEEEESTLTVDAIPLREGGESIDLWTPQKVEENPLSIDWEIAREEFHDIMGEDAPEVWKVQQELYSTGEQVGAGEGAESMRIFMDRGKQEGSMMHDPDKIVETLSYDNLSAIAEDTGQKAATIIRNFSSEDGKQMRIQGTTESGKPYGFVLYSHIDEGERVYEINGQRFDQENYDVIIENVLEKMDNVNLSISEKFDQGEGALSSKEYTTAAEQEPQVTVGEPYSSAGNRPAERPDSKVMSKRDIRRQNRRKTPWWL